MSEEMEEVVEENTSENTTSNGPTLKSKPALSLLKEFNKNKSFIKGYVTDGGILLLRETRQGNVDKVVDLLCRGAPFISDSTGVSPLHFAAYNNSVEITELLLNGGILRDLKNKVERTSLHIAAQMNHVQVLKTLLTYGADVDVVDMMRMTPLHWASEYSNVECVKLLLKYGAKVGVTDNFGRTPLDVADDEAIIELLQTPNKSAFLNVPRKSEHNNDPFDVICVDEEDTEMMETSETPDKTVDDSNESINIDSQASSSTNVNKLLQNQTSSLPKIDTLPKTFMNDDKDPMELLKEHGIQMLEPEKITTVRSAVESGQKVVLTEAGKLALDCALKKDQLKKNIPNISPKGSVVVVQNGKKCIKIHKSRLSNFQLEHDRSFLKSMTPSSSYRYFKGKYYSIEEDEDLRLQLQASINKLRSEAKLLDLFSKRKFRQANLYQQQLLSLIKFNEKKTLGEQIYNNI